MLHRGKVLDWNGNNVFMHVVYEGMQCFLPCCLASCLCSSSGSCDHSSLWYVKIDMHGFQKG